MDELTRGMHQGRAEVEAPQSVAQAEDFMAHNDQVHGVGIGLGADGDPCVVLFTDNLPADQVPDTLDGLPVRVEDSGEFTAGG